ncbi:hypothetical protein [Cupriavidus alkaliphilus]|uniref:hypothetical protein n=1 Tax=Cupriavidus alkaliphilus TaxID=942866 RepID=UPI0016086535|nr:hypothetical protein [Cupriavidus alkaliphilus]MBB2919401.1 deoxyinosine 3'endonuclease (endonuclease V) [Cupriavidus alkaliphilus]
MEVALWEIALWIGLVLGLMAVGVAVTSLIGSSVPEPVFAQAQRHGRYADLGAAPDRRGGPRRRLRRPPALPAARTARLMPVHIKT